MSYYTTSAYTFAYAEARKSDSPWTLATAPSGALLLPPPPGTVFPPTDFRAMPEADLALLLVESSLVDKLTRRALAFALAAANLASLALVGSNSLWMKGGTPPSLKITSPMNMSSSSSFRMASFRCRGVILCLLPGCMDQPASGSPAFQQVIHGGKRSKNSQSLAALPDNSRSSAVRYSSTAAVGREKGGRVNLQLKWIRPASSALTSLTYSCRGQRPAGSYRRTGLS